MKKLLQRLTVCLVIVASFFVGGLIGIKNLALLQLLDVMSEFIMALL